MNERVKELIKQATEHDYTTWDSYNQKELVYYKFSQEKFAQLIVRECGILADQYQFEKKNPNPLATERLPLLPSDFIYEHFGVES